MTNNCFQTSCPLIGASRRTREVLQEPFSPQLVFVAFDRLLQRVRCLNSEFDPVINFPRHYVATLEGEKIMILNPSPKPDIDVEEKRHV